MHRAHDYRQILKPAPPGIISYRHKFWEQQWGLIVSVKRPLLSTSTHVLLLVLEVNDPKSKRWYVWSEPMHQEMHSLKDRSTTMHLNYEYIVLHLSLRLQRNTSTKHTPTLLRFLALIIGKGFTNGLVGWRCFDLYNRSSKRTSCPSYCSLHPWKDPTPRLSILAIPGHPCR